MAAAKRALAKAKREAASRDAEKNKAYDVAHAKAESVIARIVRGNSQRWADCGTDWMNSRMKYDANRHYFQMDRGEIMLGEFDRVVRCIIDNIGVVALKIRSKEGETWYAIGEQDGEVAREQVRTGNACGDAVRAALEAIPVDMGI